MFKLPDFPAYYTLLDKLGWFALRGAGIGVIVYLLLPVVVIIPLSFSDSSFLAYPIEGWSLQWYREMFHSDDWIREHAAVLDYAVSRQRFERVSFELEGDVQRVFADAATAARTLDRIRAVHEGVEHQRMGNAACVNQAS